MATFDVVVFGATSFVGQILTRYLFERHGLAGEIRWAIAGRSSAKLEALKNELGDAARDLPVLLAEANDEASLQALCAQTRVVVSTVGPYALYGSPLVKVCAESGTDYCDLTGEPQWIARMLAQHEATAQRTGARIVHCCGFDSLPSDLGTYFLQKQSQARYQAPSTRVKLRVKAMRGTFSGGTVASMMEMLREVGKDRSILKVLQNPYAFCAQQLKLRQPNPAPVSFDDDAKSWQVPFIMAAINTKVVHRSNALQGYRYGENFCYDETQLTGNGVKGRLGAIAFASGLGGFMAAAALAPTRSLLERFVVPKPGEGPSPKAQREGYYDIRFFGKTDAGQTLVAKVTGDRDPGYGSTGKMLGEAATCLAMDISKADKAGGFWTPATVMGDALIARLQQHAGLTFSVVSVS